MTGSFGVLRQAFDAGRLTVEVDTALATGSRPLSGVGGGGIAYESVPMMCERTPASLELVRRFASHAEQFLGRPVLPVRAKATRYTGDSALHQDNELPIASVSYAAYLEPLDAESGALRLGTDAQPVETVPGDVIVFEEHVPHGSRGGGTRRQWRVDYVVDPRDDDETALVRKYYEQIFDPQWPIGYDAAAYPSYGSHWRQSAAGPWDTRLEALGVYELARRRGA